MSDATLDKQQVSEQELLQLLPNGIIVINGHGTIVKINQAAKELLGSNLINRPWIDVISEVFSPRDDDGHEISLKDGRRVNVTIRSLESMPGELIILTDLTTTREFEQAKSQQQRLAEMGKMTAHLAHQIRTPLASAMLYTDHLTRDNLPLDKKTNCIKQLKHCHTNIEQQIRDLLLFAGGGNSIVETIQLDDLCQLIKQRLTAILTQHNVELTIQINSKRLTFSAHIESLLGALGNLIDNAIKANANKIDFIIDVIEEKMLTFRVKDNGDGIEPTLINEVINPFYTTRAKGTGLGLAVVNAVAKNHGGQVQVESVLGQGSCFSLIIPLIQFNRETNNEPSTDS